MNKINLKPLSDEEFDFLDDFLDVTFEKHEIMAFDTSFLDGFCVALISGPEEPDQEVFYNYLFKPNYQEIFENNEQEKKVKELIGKLYSYIKACLSSKAREYEPYIMVLTADEEEDDVYYTTESWCTGFINGITVYEDKWKTLIDSDQGTMLAPIFLVGEHLIEDELLQDSPLKDLLPEDWIEMLYEVIPDIYAFWHKKNKKTSAI